MVFDFISTTLLNNNGNIILHHSPYSCTLKFFMVKYMIFMKSAALMTKTLYLQYDNNIASKAINWYFPCCHSYSRSANNNFF